MSLQGNLRDFHVSEILQLLGLQSKTGCLVLESPGAQVRLYVLDGRVVSARAPGTGAADPLLAFLKQLQRLTDEQERGIVALHSQTQRDVEDIVLQGRYLDPEELGQCLERMFIEELSRVASWKEGTYQFRVDEKWPFPPSVRASVEGLLMEVARRSDETSRFQEIFTDEHVILGLRDFPDLEEPFSDEERDLFGIIDGRRTLAEVAASAALTRYEVYESLHRMLESGWVEIVGRREPGPVVPDSAATAGTAVAAFTAQKPRTWSARRLVDQLVEAVTIVVLAIAVIGCSQLGRYLTERARITRDDVFVAAQLRDVRHALALYHRSEGHYPKRLHELVEGGWVSASHLRLPGVEVTYRLSGDHYQLGIDAER